MWGGGGRWGGAEKKKKGGWGVEGWRGVDKPTQSGTVACSGTFCHNGTFSHLRDVLSSTRRFVIYETLANRAAIVPFFKLGYQ